MFECFFFFTKNKVKVLSTKTNSPTAASAAHMCRCLGHPQVLLKNLRANGHHGSAGGPYVMILRFSRLLPHCSMRAGTFHELILMFCLLEPV